MKTNQLLFGAAYYSEYLPYDRVDQDMDMMVQAGMNTIRIAESTWSTLEPQDGIYDFTHIDKMLDSARQHQLYVIIGTPTYAIPTWLFKKHPDVLPLTHDGQSLYGHRQNMDISNPHYLYYAKRIITKLLEHVCNEPHVIGYQIDNETKSYDTCSQYAQNGFIEYLKLQYPDISDFNTEFGLDYWSNRINSWDDFPDIRGCINQSLNAEYKKYQRKLVTDFLNWQSDIIKDFIHDDQFITHNFDYQWINYSFGYQCDVNQYDAANAVTIAGADIYHISQNQLTGAEITCCGNIARSLKKKNYLVLETQAQGNIEWLTYEKQLRLQAYSHIANGANSVLYWHWHSIHNSFESYWKGVLSHDFSANATYREAAIIGNEWKRIGTHLINLKKRNSIAVMLDNNSLTGLSEFPLQTTGELSYNTVMRWITDALFRMNLEYDMISSQERCFSQYDYIVLPALYSASTDLLNALDAYVKDGGHLIVTFKSAFSDECLKIRHETQPYILNQCLGIQYDQFTYPNAQSGIRYISCASDQQPNCSQQFSYNSAIKEWMELVLCTTAKPLAYYTDPGWSQYCAITSNSYGKGSGLYLATMFDEALLEIVLFDYFTASGHKDMLTRVHRIHAPVIVKTGMNDFDRRIWYYFNYSDKEQDFCYTGRNGIDLLTNKIIQAKALISLPAWDFIVIEETDQETI